MGEEELERVTGTQDILELETDEVTTSSLSSRFEHFVDLSAVDTTSVPPRASIVPDQRSPPEVSP
jgi:hypothetical protein